MQHCEFIDKAFFIFIFGGVLHLHSSSGGLGIKLKGRHPNCSSVLSRDSLATWQKFHSSLLSKRGDYSIVYTFPSAISSLCRGGWPSHPQNGSIILSQAPHPQLSTINWAWHLMRVSPPVVKSTPTHALKPSPTITNFFVFNLALIL